MPEPSLSELSNIATNPDAGSVAPVPVIDNSRMVSELNNAAQFKARQDWDKYNTFLQNKKDLFRNISDIQDLDVAPQDKDALKAQAADVLGTILKDPSVAMGGGNYDALQGKIQQFKSDAMLSKQNKMDADANEMFMNRNPDLYTDENKALLENYWKQPLGKRESPMLKMPTIMDEKSMFDNVLTAATKPYTDIVGPDGKPGAGYIESGNEVHPQAISELWKLALGGQKDKYGHSILEAVKKNYNDLGPEEQAKYKDMGGDPVENYFADRGKKYLDAYFPAGSYEKTANGNYRFGKKLTADPSYLGAEKLNLQQRQLDEKSAYDKSRIAVDWGELGVKKDKLRQSKTEDQNGAATVLNEAANVINNGVETPIDYAGGKKGTVLRISDPTMLLKFAKVDAEGKTVNSPDFIDYDKNTDQLKLGFYSNNIIPGQNPDRKLIEKEIPLDKRTWLKVITARSFPNKEIGGINSLIENTLQSNGNNLYNLSKKIQAQQSGGQQQPAGATPAPAQLKAPATKTTTTKGVPSKWDKYKVSK